MITKALLDEWKRQAKKDGNLDDYEYHLGMVRKPLPYRLWKMKKAALDRLQALPMNDYSQLDKETKLCNELGY